MKYTDFVCNEHLLEKLDSSRQADTNNPISTMKMDNNGNHCQFGKINFKMKFQTSGPYCKLSWQRIILMLKMGERMG
jgi:hypothetical protein